MHSFLLAALAGFHLVSCASSRASVVLESRETLPDGWQFETEAHPNEHLSVSIALSQPKLADLEEHMLQQAYGQATASPSSPLSRAQLSEYQEPHSEAADLVLAWLADNGVQDSRADGPWVRINTTVDAVQKLFEADVAYYAYKNSSTPVLRAPSYSIPTSLAGFVDFVFPLAHFMPPAAARTSAPAASQKQRLTRLARRQSKGGGGGWGGGWRGHRNSTFPWPKMACAPNKVTPDCIRQMYNWPLSLNSGTTTPPANSSNQTQPAVSPPVRLGIAGFLNEYVNHQDVSEFLQIYAPSIAHAPPTTTAASVTTPAAYNFSIALVNNGTNLQVPRYRAGLEASLDVQYAMALAYPAQITFYSTGGRGEKLDAGGRRVDPRFSDNEPYLDLLEYLVGLPDDEGDGAEGAGDDSKSGALPHVLSISYSDDEQSVPQPYAARVCGLLMQLAARGTTVLAATGDGGSRGIGRNPCVRNDGSQRRALLPTFPASCPWVTAVGATEAAAVGMGASAAAPVAADYSSGGFSNYFARPAWQDGAVSAYLGRLGDGDDDKAGLYNRSGRAVPDIAAVGSHFQLIWGAVTTSTDGTSASTPVVASMVAAVNNARRRAGKPVLGWLNPALYSSGVQSALQDVVSGVSMGCTFNRTAKIPGWPAAPGWDAVTGLGVPSDFAKFAAALMDV